MFIASIPIPVRSSGAPCALVRSVYIPLLTERDRSGIRSYKHVAPPEQEPRHQLKMTFRAKPLYVHYGVFLCPRDSLVDSCYQ